MFLTIVDFIVGLFLINNAEGFLLGVGWVMAISGTIGVIWMGITFIGILFSKWK